MGDKLNISDQELRASGGAADTVASDLGEPLRKARDDAKAAGVSLRQWEFGAQVASSGTLWHEAIEGLRGKVRANADALRLVASSHKANDFDVYTTFESWGS